MSAKPISLALSAMIALAILVQFRIAPHVPGWFDVPFHLWRMAKFFTNFAALIALAAMIAHLRGRLTADLAATTVIATSFTGITYAALIADGAPVPPGYEIPDLLLHRILPAAMPLWWLTQAPRPCALRPLLWITPGLIYLPYMEARGYLTGVWPYAFLDPALVSPLRIAVTLAGLTLMALALAFALWTLSQPRKARPKAPLRPAKSALPDPQAR